MGQQSIYKTHTKLHEHVLITQMCIKAGIKRFGQKGSDVLLKELNKLHSRDALLKLMKNNLSSADRRRALRYLMFIKKKRDRTIKLQGCADGRSQ